MNYKGIIIGILLSSFLVPAHAENINLSFYAGASKTLYDSRYYPALFGEGVAPYCPTFAIRVGMQDFRPTKLASITKHPEFGIGFQFDGLGSIVPANGPGVGNFYSIFGYIDRTLFNLGRFSLAYTGQYGLGLMFNRRYDARTNPYNVMISQVANSHISLGLQARYNITPKYNAGIAFAFTHYSNAAFTLPNYGLNKFELKLLLGMKTAPEDQKVEKEIEDDGFKRKFQFGVHASGGAKSNFHYYNKYKVVKRYPKMSFQANAMYKYCRTHATGLGIDLFVTPNYKAIKQADGLGNTDTALSAGLSLLHELSYSNLSLTLGVGYYLYHMDNIKMDYNFYQLINLKYYLPKVADLYAGIVLKAHGLKVAESLQFCIGKRF